MLGWYLLKAGSVDDGEALFRDLRVARPDDGDLLVLIGSARFDAGLEESALTAFDEAITLATELQSTWTLDRARIERRATREDMGLPLDEHDRLVRSPSLPPGEQTAWFLVWFPPDQHELALARWPDLEDDLSDPAAYARRMEHELRVLHRMTGRCPGIAALDVVELESWAVGQDYDPDSGIARSQFAAELGHSGLAEPWPPGRNEPCWCRSGRKYKRCCGAD